MRSLTTALEYWVEGARGAGEGWGVMLLLLQGTGNVDITLYVKQAAKMVGACSQWGDIIFSQ